MASAGQYAIICNSHQTDNCASTSSLNFFAGRMIFLSKHWRQQLWRQCTTHHLQVRINDVKPHVGVLDVTVSYIFFHSILYLNTAMSTAECQCSQDDASFKVIFQYICQPSSCLYHFLPPLCDTSVFSRFTTASWFTCPIPCTKNIALLLTML